MCVKELTVVVNVTRAGDLKDGDTFLRVDEDEDGGPGLPGVVWERVKKLRSDPGDRRPKITHKVKIRRQSDGKIEHVLIGLQVLRLE